MKTFKVGLIVFGSFIAVFLVGGLVLPSHWSVERSVVINAEPAVIYPYVANFKTGWPQWSTFGPQGPSVQYTHSGPEEGAGATRSWSTAERGEGYQKILKADPLTGVQFEVLIEEAKFKIDGWLTFEPTGSVTKVTWRNEGDVGINPVRRYMAMSVNKMMGLTFEKSLTALKQKVEGTVSSK